MDTIVQLKAEGGMAAGLLSVPLWASLVSDVSMLASCVAAICGAIVGVHAVYRIYRRYYP